MVASEYSESARYGAPAICLAGVLLLTLMVGCNRGNAPAGATPAGSAAAGESQPAITVRTLTVTPMRLASEAEVTGTLQGTSDLMLPAQASGVIRERVVAEGTRVAKDTLLLRQDSAVLQQQLASAQADLKAAEAMLAKIRSGAREEERRIAEQQVARAQADYDQALSDFQRAESLYRDGIISRSERDNAETRLKVAETARNTALANRDQIQTGARPEDIQLAEANRSGAVARVGLYQTQIAQTQVRAPMDGYLIEFLKDVGEMATPGTPVARFTSEGDLELRLSLPDSQILGLTLGQTLPIAIPAAAAELTPTGTVTYLSPAGDAMSRLFEVRLAIPNAGQALRAGMVATVTIPVAAIDNALVIPESAVLSPGANPHVYVVENGAAKQRPVTPGLAANGLVAITTGLAAGDAVIIEGQTLVADDMRVTIAPTPDTAAAE